MQHMLVRCGAEQEASKEDAEGEAEAVKETEGECECKVYNRRGQILTTNNCCRKGKTRVMQGCKNERNNGELDSEKGVQLLVL